LQYALSNTALGDEVWVAGGEYKPAVSDRSVSFELLDAVPMYGGFAMTETLREQRNWVTHVVTLSGDLNGNGMDDADSYHVVRADAVTHGTIFDGFVVTGGHANGVEPNDRGAGMVNHGGNPTLRNVTFIHNAADAASGFGGGMFNDYSGPLLINTVFISNTAYNGGGMANWKSTGIVITGTLFVDNAADSGGGMFNEDSSPSLTDVTFRANSAASAGGAMANWNESSPILESATVLSNTAFTGGGIYSVYDSKPALTNVTLAGNTADNGGGIYNDVNSDASLVNVAFRGNVAAGGFGGGLQVNRSSASLVNTVFISNTAYAGGGVSSDHARLSLVNATFGGNTADSGGAFANDQYSIAIITNTVIWGNSVPGITNTIGAITVSFSLLQNDCPTGASCLSNVLTGTNPLFVNLAAGDLRLRVGSPAVDAGNNDAIPPGITFDLAGTHRRLDVTGAPDTGYGEPPLVDMGAYEIAVPDVAVSARARRGAAPGQPVTYTVIFSNAGSLPAAGVVITDILPQGLSLTPFEMTHSGAAITPTGGGGYTWQVQDLPPGAGGVITLSATSRQDLSSLPQIFTNTVTITATTPDGNARNNDAAARLPVVSPNTTLTLTSRPNPSYVDEPAYFTVTVKGGSTGIVTPTGIVSLGLPGEVVELAVDERGTARYATSTLPRGTHAITAEYGGDDIFLPSAAALAGGQVVTDSPISNLVISNDGPTVLGRASTFTVTSKGSNIIYTWDWGDGPPHQNLSPVTPAIGTAAPITFSHTYTPANTYTARLTATNSVSRLVVTSTIKIVEVRPRAFMPALTCVILSSPRVFIPLLMKATAGTSR
jgi:uncharacterized repeat protein (TIGR01451 family)